MKEENAMEEGTKDTPEEATAKGASEEAAVRGSSAATSSNPRQFLWILLVVPAIIALAVSLSLGLSDDDDTTNGSSGSISKVPTFAVSLSAISPETIRQSYPSCEALSTDLVQASRLLANSVIEKNARWFYHQDYGGGDVGVLMGEPAIFRGDIDVVADSAGAPESASAGIAAPSQPVTEDSYGTNNQVVGVDEADIIKSNGVQVFAAYGREIVVLDADNVTISSRTELPETPKECYSDNIASMLLIGERLVVVTNGYCDNYGDSLRIVSGAGNTRVFVYNTVNMAVLSSEALQGSYVAARSIGDNLHIVTSSWLNAYNSYTQYLDPYREEIYGREPEEDVFRTMALLEAENRMDAFVSQITEELDCANMQKLALMQNSDDMLEFGGILESMATVYSFSVSNLSEKISSTSMILPTAGWQVYASQERLVLASEGWWIEEGSDGGARQETYLITYLLEGPSATAMTLGTVPGYVLNQFSIDHVQQNGVDYLRIATSTRERWAFAQRWTQTEDSSSQVTVLEINDSDSGKMAVVGQLNNLGKPGERIYSVRFQGDSGYVVTFQQTDPFYTLDLSDPSDPQAVGELEIPGFSNYLHPIGDNLILGVGQGADETGRTLGLQISLFDVSDFSQPLRVQNYLEGGDGGYSSSEAQYDHKAFRYLDESRLLILPLTVYGDRGDNDGFDGFRLYKIDEEAGITPYFSIEHASSNFYDGCWSSAGYLQARSLVFGGDIMTFKGHSILSHDLTSQLPDTTPIKLDDGIVDCSPYYFH